MTLSFRDYVLNHSPEDSQAGDFIADAKHPAAQQIPDVTTWAQVEMWLKNQGGHAVIEGARTVWSRYQLAKDTINVPIARGYTVSDLIELLQKEDPQAHVVKCSVGKNPVSRVEGFSKVMIRSGSKELSAIMLE